MDFRLNAKEAQLRDIFTALPPEMLTWLDSTEVKGTGDIDAALKGRYIAASNTMPDFLTGNAGFPVCNPIASTSGSTRSPSGWTKTISMRRSA
jgi:hypothetical protein